MKTQLLRWLSLAVTMAIGQHAIAAGTQFSADMVLKSEGQTQVMRYYQGNQKMRTETKMEDGNRVISIIDIPGNKMITLMPETNTYMEMTGVDESQDWFDGMKFEKEGRNDPDYEVKKVGTEKVNGYMCDKYVSVPKKPGLEKSTTWFSTKLGYPIKSVSPSHSMELTNIKEGTQPASLFTVPKGYQKMPGMDDYYRGMMQQQSRENESTSTRNETRGAEQEDISDAIGKGIRGLFGK